MDIIVCVPKSESKNIKKEDEYARDKNVVQYWSLSKKPKNLQVGDKVYFVVDGKISYYHEFLGFEENIKCDVTGRIWSGVNLKLKYPEVKLQNPVPMTSFRGFRYKRDTQKSVLDVPSRISIEKSEFYGHNQ